MKEILFRGKRVDNGEWVEGYYGACDEYGDNGGVEHMYRDTCTRLHYIIHTSGAPSHLVYPDTVSQWTGLKDKNGVKVFEGDIHNISEEYGGGYIPRLIGFDKGCTTSTSVKCSHHKTLIVEFDFISINEVVGNKWDNPELMEG